MTPSTLAELIAKVHTQHCSDELDVLCDRAEALERELRDERRAREEARDAAIARLQEVERERDTARECMLHNEQELHRADALIGAARAMLSKHEIAATVRTATGGPLSVCPECGQASMHKRGCAWAEAMGGWET